MTDAQNKILLEVRQIAMEVLGNQQVDLYLFGSWAKGTPAVYSDIDIAVGSPVPLPPGIFARLRERFEESHIPYRVDVVDLNSVAPEFREKVKQQGVSWNA